MGHERLRGRIRYDFVHQQSATVILRVVDLIFIIMPFSMVTFFVRSLVRKKIMRVGEKNISFVFASVVLNNFLITYYNRTRFSRMNYINLIEDYY